MRIDIPTDGWERTSARYRAALPFQDVNLQVQAYAGFSHALYEATQGLARLFSHKKTVGFVGPLPPALESIAIGFSQEAYTVKVLSTVEQADPAAALTALLPELIFVVYSIDDPVTGQLHDHSKLDALLKDKRVFRIGISHSAHRHQSLSRPLPFEVKILSLRKDLALAVGGERFRVSPLLAQRMPWAFDEGARAGEELACEADSEVMRRKIAVQSFESSLPEGFLAYFTPGASRLWDRAVIYHPDFDGSAVIDLLAEKLRAPIGLPGEAGPLEATSPCRWSDPRFIDWLIGRGESEAIVRGLVVIDSHLADSRTYAALAETARDLRALQG